MDDTAKKANLILVRFVTDIETKVRYGQRQRNAMVEALNRGEDPRGYRVEWISKVANQVISLLGERGIEFNTAYPQDRISTEDFQDVLATAQARLRAKTSG